MWASVETDKFMTLSAQRARRIVRLFVISKGSVGFAQLSGDFQIILAKDGGNEPSSLSNHFERPSEMLRLQYRVQVMLTHYMFGLLSLLKCSRGRKGKVHWKTWGRAQKQRGDEEKSRREKEYDNTIRQISVICCKEFGETFLWDWQFGVAAALGASHGKTLPASTHTLRTQQDLRNAIWPWSCALSIGLPWAFLPRVTLLCLCSTAVWLFPRQEM